VVSDITDCASGLFKDNGLGTVVMCAIVGTGGQ